MGSLAFVGFARYVYGACSLPELLFGEPRIADLNSSDKRGDFAFGIVHHGRSSCGGQPRRICEDGLAKRSWQDEFGRNIADLQSQPVDFLFQRVDLFFCRTLFHGTLLSAFSAAVSLGGRENIFGFDAL